MGTFTDDRRDCIVGTEAPPCERPMQFSTVTRTLYFAGRQVKVEGRYGVGGYVEWPQPDRLSSNARHHPYGEERSTSSTEYKFATYQREASGLDYALNRYYSSVYGRFLSSDPYHASGGPSDPGSWNRYAYVQGDPVNKFDPKGLMLANPDACIYQIMSGGTPYDCADDEYGQGGGFSVQLSSSGDVPCEIDADKINAYIKQTPIFGDPKLGKPLEGMGQSFIDSALKYNTSPAILVAIGFQESHWGYDTKSGGSNNAFGLKNASGLLRFDSWQEGISVAAKSVDSAYNRGNRSLEDLYSAKPGAYCTHVGCDDPNVLKSMKDRVRALKGNPDYLGFDCEMRNGKLLKKKP